MSEIDHKITAAEASLISFCLGKTMLKNAGILVHEMRVSDAKPMKAAYKLKTKQLVTLSNAFHQMFKGANSYTNKFEQEHIEEAIDNLLDSLWTVKKQITEDKKERDEIRFRVPRTSEEIHELRSQLSSREDK